MVDGAYDPKASKNKVMHKIWKIPDTYLPTLQKCHLLASYS